LSYRQALAENVIAHFKIAFIGVNMSVQERFDYDEYESYFQEVKAYLLRNGIKYKSFGEFMREVNRLSGGDLSDIMTINARIYQKCWNLKRLLLAGISSKYELLNNNNLLEIIKKSSGVLIFSQFKEAATLAVNMLKNKK
jgi:RNA polymerase primary sigma factor